ncbi:MAG: hypothetical protein JL50_18550 [Peptococcaceae bacterium BICA1-7]|nr:MAG: hypothetical protein JL50_18550 [Peptococcaceae bacterium BICA1-7]HBV99065.1 hypothetical protein [Desulfotomaculum sp.]
MSGEKNKLGAGEKNNVIPLGEGWHGTESRPGEDTSLNDLVRHMRSLRDSIPVNQKLRRDLRARLLEGVGPQTEERPAFNYQEKRGPAGRPWWAAGLIAAAALGIIIYIALGPFGCRTLDGGQTAEVGRFWTGEAPLLPAVSPGDGVIVVERGGALLLLGRQGEQFSSVNPPPGVRYGSPCWSPDGKRLALVRQGGSGWEIISIEIPKVEVRDIQRTLEEGLERAVVLARSPAASPVAHLSWSPGSDRIAYAVTEDSENGIYLAAAGSEPVFFGPGAQVAWSPDGNWLAVEREEAQGRSLRVVSINGEAEYTLGQGTFPVWSEKGFLFFLQTSVREKILSYLPDGSPQFKVQIKTGEIRWVYLGSGKGLEKVFDREPDGIEPRLLMTPDTPAGNVELQWLKSLELSGDRTPKTLYLDRAGEIEGLVPGDGSSLLLSRRDGGIVVISRVGYSVRKTDGGDNQ